MGKRVMTNALVLPPVAEQRGQIASQMMALVEGAQGQQAASLVICRRKNRRERVETVERERSVVVEHFVSSDGCSERECWVRKPSVHQPFRASFLFWLETS
jgi:hypothetical protein